MSGDIPLWRPRYLRQVSPDFEAPPRFSPIKVVGMKGLIGFKADIIEPISASSPDDWVAIVKDLQEWGEVPNPSKVSKLISEQTDRGLVATLSAEEEWIAEFLPWGSDGLLRARSRNSPNDSDSPVGGYTWKDRDVLILRRKVATKESSETKLVRHLQENDLESCTTILRESGMCLGRFHSSMMPLRELPPDQKRWNKRNEKMERLLRAQYIWRAPYTKEQPCTVTLLDVRFSDLSKDSIRVGPPRLSDALIPHESEKPAMRDLASLVHDLSRIHHRVETELQLEKLRLALIDGWRETAPEVWASEGAFYSHKGGMAIWEYEQCLMDIMEATSNQSGAPQPAVEMLRYVKMYQKKMFNNRTLAALSFMAFFFGAASLANQFPPSPAVMIPSLASFAVGYFCFRTYRRMSPSPEKPFTEI